MQDRAARIVHHAFPSTRVLSTRPLVGGIAAATSLVEAEFPDGSTTRVVTREFSAYCYEEDDEFASHHFEVLSDLWRLGLKIPKPLAFGGRSEEFPTGYMVLSYVPGEVDFMGQEGRDFAQGYAEELASIHSAKPRCANVLPTQKFRPVDRGEPNADFGEAEILDALQFVELAPSGPLVLCHGDLWPGNVIWSGNSVAGVIDWDNVLMGERLYDLASARLDLWFILGAPVAEEFTERYRANTGADLSNLPIWDLRACVRLIRGFDSWPDVFPMMGRPDVTRETLIRDIKAFATAAIAALPGRY